MRHAPCSSGAWDIVMSFVRNVVASSVGLTSLLPRELPRRWAAAVLALGLGLNGIGQCLCAPQPDSACAPQACCPKSASHHHRMPETGASVEASSAACCLSQTTASPVAVRIDDREVLRHVSAVVTAIHVASDVPTTPTTIGAAPWRSLSWSPPRTTVLRI